MKTKQRTKRKTTTPAPVVHIGVTKETVHAQVVGLREILRQKNEDAVLLAAIRALQNAWEIDAPITFSNCVFESNK